MSCRPSSPPPPLSSTAIIASSVVPSDQEHTCGLDDNIFVDPPSQSRGLHCPICFLVLRNPFLLSCCGKHICEVCIDTIDRVHGVGQPCPCCREKSFTVLLNKEKKQEILALKVYCSNKELGCDWTGELSDEQRHVDTKCVYVQRKCRHGCGEKYLRSSLPTHEQYECINRPVKVILNTFMKQTAEKMAEQDMLLTEMKEQLKKHQEREHEMLKEIQELKDRENVCQLEIVEENVYVDKGMWRFVCSPAIKEKWFDLIERMHGKGITLSLNEDNSCLTIKGERRVINIGKKILAEFETSVQLLRIPSVHHDAVFYFTNYPTAVEEIEKDLKVHIELEQVESEAGQSLEGECSQETEQTYAMVDITDYIIDVYTKVCTAKTSEGQAINLFTGDMKRYSEAEVVVCYCNERFECIDEVSQTIIDTIGGDLSQQIGSHLEKHGPVQSPYDSVLFPCHSSSAIKAVVLTVVPLFDPSSISIERYFALLRKMVRSILRHCSAYSSVAIASLSRGTPQQEPSAIALLNEISSYFDNSQSDLKIINIFILGSEIDVFTKALEVEFDSVTVETQTAASSSTPSHQDKTKFIRMLPNGVLFRVIFDDITSQKVDVVVVVNSSIPDLARVGNCISRTLLKKGGIDLQTARENQIRQGLKPTDGRAVETRCEGMGQLVCKSIFHTVLNSPDLKKSVVSCLDRAEKMKYTSIAFPRIWGKEGQMNRVVTNLKSALRLFVKRSKPSCIKVINMMFLNRDTFDQFQEIFSREEGVAIDDDFSSPMKASASSKATPTSPMPMNISKENDLNKSIISECSVNDYETNTSTFAIYGLDMTSVEMAKNRLQSLIDILL